MAELLFIGLGLHDERDLSQRAVEALRGVDRLYLERYTSHWSSEAVQRLGALVGKPLVELGREQVEEQRTILQALREVSSVALLVVGEPFAATTHVSLRLAAEAAGHTWRLLHNASILTAAASLSGLSHYKFGRTVSLPRPAPGYRPSSPYDGILANRAAGLHTLVLLDLDPAGGTFLTAPEALRVLREMEEERQGGILSETHDVLIVARAGSPDERVFAGPPSVLERMDVGAPLHCLIVPAPQLHFVEQEAIASWKARGP